MPYTLWKYTVFMQQGVKRPIDLGAGTIVMAEKTICMVGMHKFGFYKPQKWMERFRQEFRAY